MVTGIYRLWSLEFADFGVLPIEDSDGNHLTDEQTRKPLAGGLKFVLWSLKAILDHWAKAYGLSHYTSNEPCEFCTATRQGHWKGWHTYFGPDATRKAQSFTAD